jgi:hypothetical protein
VVVTTKPYSLVWGNIPDLRKSFEDSHAKLNNYLRARIETPNLRGYVQLLKINSQRQGKKITYPVEIDGEKEMMWMRELEQYLVFQPITLMLGT